MPIDRAPPLNSFLDCDVVAVPPRPEECSSESSSGKSIEVRPPQEVVANAMSPLTDILTIELRAPIAALPV
jgi:hypothetical protein